MTPLTVTSPLAELLDPESLPPLDAGRPAPEKAALLARLTPATLTAPRPPRDRAMAEACLAALWLHHGFWDEAHRIAQSIDTPEGYYWHGIIHRREGDGSNAAYWLRRGGAHPIHAALANGARELIQANACDSRVDFLLSQGPWNPISFIDLCETYRGIQSSTEIVCRQIQRLEWRLLFEFCLERAAG